MGGLHSLFYKPPSIPKVLREYNYNIYDQKLGLAEGFFQAFKIILPQMMVKASQVVSPVLLITSENDAYVPVDMAERVKSHFKEMSSFQIPRCGHMSFLEKQTDFNEGYVKFVNNIEYRKSSRSQIA